MGTTCPDLSGSPLQPARCRRHRDRIVDRAGLLVKVINSQVRINQWVLIIRLIKGGAN
jgi:hypothetical protein